MQHTCHDWSTHRLYARRQKVGDENLLYNRKLQGRPGKSSSTAADGLTIGAAEPAGSDRYSDEAVSAICPAYSIPWVNLQRSHWCLPLRRIRRRPSVRKLKAWKTS